MAYQPKPVGYFCAVISFGVTAHPAVTVGVFGQGFIKALLGEIREEHRGKIELRIGALPQQEVGDAFLAAGADHKVHRGQLAVQVAFNRLLVDVSRGQSAVLHLTGNGAHGIGQLGVGTIVQAEVHNAGLVVLRQVHHVVHSVQHALLQPFTAAAEQYLTVALVHFLGNGAEVIGK